MRSRWFSGRAAGVFEPSGSYGRFRCCTGSSPTRPSWSAAFIVFVAVGGLMAWRWPRLLWLHVPAVAWGLAS